MAAVCRAIEKDRVAGTVEGLRRFKKIVIFYFYGFSVFISKITFALEDRFLWFLGVYISTFSHKNGFRQFQLLKLSRKFFVARNCGPYSTPD